MRITGIVLIVLGWLTLAFQCIGYFGKHDPPPPMEGIEKVAYYTGFNLFLIIAVLLLLIGYRIRRKARRKKIKKDLLDNFLTDSPKTPGA